MSGVTARAAFAAAMRDFSEPALGVAVSGGGDSIALLRIAADWAADRGIRLAAVTVDHGLRPEAAQEAAFVAETCAALGVAHDALHWGGWDGCGNLQAQARAARYRLIADWAGARGIGVVALAHTCDDQAETFLMRLARQAGVDGLSAMADRRMGDVRFMRPLLSVSRAALRDELQALGQGWVEDPSNTDVRYDRVRMRQQLDGLSDLGITPGALSAVAQNLSQAQEALNWAAHGFALQHVRMNGPDVMIDRAAFLALPVELQRRVMVHTLKWLTGADYAPRRQSVADVLDAAQGLRPATLHGCRMTHRKDTLYLFREYAAVADMRTAPGQVWDRRYCLSGPEGVHVAALGQVGLDALPNWRDMRRPAAAVMADPAIWQDGRLLAAPVSGMADGWRIDWAPGRTDYHSALLTH